VPTRRVDWFCHDSADVAVTPFKPGGIIEANAIPVDGMVDESYRLASPPLDPTLPLLYGDGQVSLMLADEVFFVGLFVQSAGTIRNLPIIRFGNISRLASEPIVIETKARGLVKIDAHLVEARSHGGHSGSPAFWAFPYSEIKGMNHPELGTLYLPLERQVVALIGLVSAHFDIPTKATTGDADFEIKANSGIAAVTPAHKIKELLERRDVMEEREKRDPDAMLKSKAATTDVAEKPFGRSDFDRALRKVSRRQTTRSSKADQASSET
jgi:hypothetical protein